MSENTVEYGNVPVAFSAPVHDERGRPVVTVRGEVDLATTCELLGAIGVAGSRLDGIPVAFVDLRETAFIDITGVWHLVEQAQAMRQLGGDLRLVIPREGPVAHVFGLLGIDRILDLYHELDTGASEQESEIREEQWS